MTDASHTLAETWPWPQHSAIVRQLVLGLLRCGFELLAFPRAAELSIMAPDFAPEAQPRLPGSDPSRWQKLVGVAPDGKWGPVTEAATKRWQSEHGLEPDGIVGQKTWAEMARNCCHALVLELPTRGEARLTLSRSEDEDEVVLELGTDALGDTLEALLEHIRSERA